MRAILFKINEDGKHEKEKEFDCENITHAMSIVVESLYDDKYFTQDEVRYFSNNLVDGIKKKYNLELLQDVAGIIEFSLIKRGYTSERYKKILVGYSDYIDNVIDKTLLGVIQTFAYALNMPGNKSRAEKYYAETIVDELWKEINTHKRSLGEKKFIYMAGRTAEYMLNLADESDIETFNRMCGAIHEFERQLGLEE